MMNISALKSLISKLRPKEKQKGKHYKKPEEVVLPPIPEELDENFIKLIKRLKNMQNIPLDLLEQIYLFMDEHNKFVTTFSVCEKGCSACCNIPVNVSRLEAEYIQRKTGHKLSNRIILKTGRSPCPFLESDAACSIYQHRPYNCRTFHTLDNPKYCSTDENHAVYGVSSMGYGSTMMAQLAAIIRHVNKGEYKDIRAYFG
ncbi:YkgJ family cysteine cluster protein [Shewanella algae]|uniref:YkgJ family cysteine cluster protein n=2 Tax=Shewanella algae TaxID=38313 RepID=UPI003004A173